MTIAFVQQGDARTASGTTVDVTLTGVGAGNLIVLNCMRSGATDRTLTTSDTTNGDAVSVAVAETVSSVGGTAAEVAIDYIPVATGGNTTYRLTASGTTEIELDVFEFSHDGTATLDQSSTGDNASGTSHVCAASGLIDTAAGAVVTTCIRFNGSSGGGSNPSGFTMSALSGTYVRSGYKGPGTYTDENAAQTTVNNRYSIGAVASFAEVGGATVLKGGLALMGVGV